MAADSLNIYALWSGHGGKNWFLTWRSVSGRFLLGYLHKACQCLPWHGFISLRYGLVQDFRYQCLHDKSYQLPNGRHISPYPLCTVLLLSWYWISKRVPLYSDWCLRKKHRWQYQSWNMFPHISWSVICAIAGKNCMQKNMILTDQNLQMCHIVLLIGTDNWIPR